MLLIPFWVCSRSLRKYWRLCGKEQTGLEGKRARRRQSVAANVRSRKRRDSSFGDDTDDDEDDDATDGAPARVGMAAIGPAAFTKRFYHSAEIQDAVADATCATSQAEAADYAAGAAGYHHGHGGSHHGGSFASTADDIAERLARMEASGSEQKDALDSLHTRMSLLLDEQRRMLSAASSQPRAAAATAAAPYARMTAAERRFELPALEKSLGRTPTPPRQVEEPRWPAPSHAPSSISPQNGGRERLASHDAALARRAAIHAQPRAASATLATLAAEATAAPPPSLRATNGCAESALAARASSAAPPVTSSRPVSRPACRRPAWSGSDELPEPAQLPPSSQQPFAGGAPARSTATPRRVGCADSAVDVASPRFDVAEPSPRAQEIARRTAAAAASRPASRPVRPLARQPQRPAAE